jgi:hypothetical protein
MLESDKNGVPSHPDTPAKPPHDAGFTGTAKQL